MKKLHLLILFIIVSVYLFSGYLINSKRVLPLENDEAAHLTHSFYYCDILKNPFPHTIDRLLNVDDQWPPLYHFLSGLFCAVSNSGSFYVFFVFHLALFTLILFGLYFFALELTGSDKSALLSAIIFSAYPATFIMNSWFVIEFFLSLIVLFSIFCLFLSNLFQNKRYSILFGISFGLGMLTKWTFVFFVIGPLIYALCHSFKKKEKDWLVNFILSIIISVLIVFPWYSRHFIELIKKIPIGLTRTAEYLPILSVKGIFFYIQSIYYEISFIFIVFFLISLKWFMSLKNKDYRNMIFISMIVSYLVLTGITNKWGHYIFPVLPLFALVTGIGIGALFERFNKKLIFIFLFCFAVLIRNVLFEHIFFPASKIFDSYSSVKTECLNPRDPYKIFGMIFRDFVRVCYFDRYSYLTLCNKNNMEDILSTAENLSYNKSSPIEIAVFDFVNPPMFFNFRFLSVQEERRFEFISFPYGMSNFFKKINTSEFLVVNLNECIFNDSCVDKIIDNEKTDKLYNMNMENIAKLKHLLASVLGNFELVKPYVAYAVSPSKDSVVLLLKKKQSAVSSGSSYLNNPETVLRNMVGNIPAYNKGAYIFLPVTIKSLGINEEIVFDNGVMYLDKTNNNRNILLRVGLKIWGKIINSEDFVWAPPQVGENKFVFRGYCRTMPISQIWEFIIKNNDVYLKVYLKVGMMVLRLEDFNIYMAPLDQNDLQKQGYNFVLEGMGATKGLLNNPRTERKNVFLNGLNEYNIFSGCFKFNNKSR